MEKGVKYQPFLKDVEYKIELLPGTEPLHGPIYPLSAERLETLWKYIAKNIENGRITPFTSPAGSPMLFIPKDNKTLRLYINYKSLNRIIIKNKYPLPFIKDFMDQLNQIKYFSKINLRDTFHKIRVNPGDH